MKHHIRLVLWASIVCIASITHASLWGSYGTPLGSNLYDSYLAPAGHGNPNDGMDIITVSHATSATHHYFKIDLEGAPSATDGSGNLNFSGMYGVYIDADNNAATGAAGTDWLYIPDAVTGIDLILDSHYDPFFNGFNQFDHHSYSTGAFITTPNVGHEENGVTLEWSVAKTDLSGEFKFWVATHDQGSSAPTYDLEGSWVIPEPASAAMIALTGLGLFVRKRLFF
jgi:hypothetical protein